MVLVGVVCVQLMWLDERSIEACSTLFLFFVYSNTHPNTRKSAIGQDFQCILRDDACVEHMPTKNSDRHEKWKSNQITHHRVGTPYECTVVHKSDIDIFLPPPFLHI